MSTREKNVGKSNYAEHKIQPWDIWIEYDLNPWDADIIKRVLRTKRDEDPVMEYEKIIHVCQERIRQLNLRPSVTEQKNQSYADALIAAAAGPRSSMKASGDIL